MVKKDTIYKSSTKHLLSITINLQSCPNHYCHRVMGTQTCENLITRSQRSIQNGLYKILQRKTQSITKEHYDTSTSRKSNIKNGPMCF